MSESMILSIFFAIIGIVLSVMIASITTRYEIGKENKEEEERRRRNKK